MKTYIPGSKRAMYLLAAAIFILFSCTMAFAEDIYIAQTAAGGNTGVNCSNAHSITWLNTSGNWGTGADKVSAGDTVHLCGSFTTGLTAQASGSSGSPITLLFEPGAKFSTAVWSNTAGAIYGSGKSYIIIDGGTDGIIENTDNGSAASHGNSLPSVGIILENVSNIEIKNMTIRNIYHRTDTMDFSDGARAGSGCIYMSGGSNLSIHDCNLSWAGFIINLRVSLPNPIDWNIYNNTVTNCNTNMRVSFYANTTLDGLNIYNNTWNTGTAWEIGDLSDPYHGECIHLDAGAQTGYINNLKVYNNFFGPEMVRRTAELFATALFFDEIPGNNHWFYNNVFHYHTGFDAGDGMLCRSSRQVGTGFKVYNNTFVYETAGKMGIELGYSSNNDTEIKNNIFINTNAGIYCSGGLSLVNANQVDYNVYYGVTYWDNNGNWSTWHSTKGYDVNGSNGANPTLDANYVPTVTDTVARNKGIDLSAYFATDKRGNPRPIGAGTWDCGAFEYNAGQTPASPVGVRIVAPSQQ
jgi:hypothetical protein